jgi:hypothetical protein
VVFLQDLVYIRWGKERGEVGFFSICQVVVGEGELVSVLLLCVLYFMIRSKIGLYM